MTWSVLSPPSRKPPASRWAQTHLATVSAVGAGMIGIASIWYFLTPHTTSNGTSTGSMLGAFVLALFGSVFFLVPINEAMERRFAPPKTSPTPEELASMLKTASTMIESTRQALEREQNELARLKELVRAQQELASLDNAQAEAVARMLQDKLVLAGRRSFLVTTALTVLSIVVGVAATLLIQ